MNVRTLPDPIVTEAGNYRHFVTLTKAEAAIRITLCLPTWSECGRWVLPNPTGEFCPDCLAAMAVSP